MLAATFDIGPNVLTAVMALIGLGTLIVQNTLARKRAKEIQDKQSELIANLTQTNGGSSTKDQLNRIEARQIRSERRVDRIEKRLGLDPPDAPLPPPPPPVPPLR